MQFRTHRMEMVISFVSCPIADTSSSHSAIIYCNAFTFCLPMNILQSSSLHKPSFSVLFLSTSTHPSGSFSVLCIVTAKLFHVLLPCLGTEQASKSLTKYHHRNASSHKSILIPHSCNQFFFPPWWFQNLFLWAEDFHTATVKIRLYYFKTTGGLSAAQAMTSFPC